MLPSTLLICVCLQAGPAPTPEAPPAPAAKPEITRDELVHTLSFLASDELEGRATASVGIRAAGAHLAERLKLAGVEPAGDEGTYFQAVPMVRSRSVAAPECSLSGGGAAQAFALGVDYEVPAEPFSRKDLRIVVADAPERLPQAADPAVVLVLDATMSQRRQWLADKQLGDGSGFALLVVRGQKAQGKPRESLSSRLEPLGGGSARRAGPLVLRANDAMLAALKAAGPDARFALDTHVERERSDCRNVVGRIEGKGTAARPELADSAVVLSAHYDHIGLDTRAKEGEDRVNNGADDDASGCAMLLEIAGALAGGPAPARDVVVLFATGEEIGLVGTEHYLDHPAVPLERTVANLNFEMTGRPDPKAGGAGRLWLTGHERTNLMEAWSAAALLVVPDPYPEQSFFQRSDNYAFVKRGVVGQTLSSYNLHRDYHHPGDEVQRIDFDHMETATREAAKAVRMVADGTVDPAWKPGGLPERPR